MDDIESPSSSSTSGSRNGGGGRRNQQRYAAEEDEEVEGIKCNGRSCKSCSAGVIADCVAVCCCPCAVFEILAFTFFKVPYVMGRRWLAKGRLKMRKKKKNGKETSDEEMSESVVVVGGKNGNSRVFGVGSEEFELGNEAVEMGNDSFSAEEEDDVWLELYKIGHLGFGRVSYSTSGSSSHRKITSL